MKPGETDTNKKTVYFKVFSEDGIPCDGVDAPVFVPIAGELQVNRDLAGYTNATLANFAHIADGDYKYTFLDGEISGSIEGTILLRTKRLAPAADPIRTQTIVVPLLFNDLERWLGSTPNALSSGNVPAEATSVLTRLGNPAGASVSADIASVKSTADSLQTTVTELHKIGVGRWKIFNNQLVIYDTNGITPLRTFDLLDDNEDPSMTKIFERLPVP